MPAAGPETQDAADGQAWYSYAIVRVVPRVERGESINVGIILFVRTLNYLTARIELPEQILMALAPDLDLTRLREHLGVYQAIAAGDPAGGPIAASPPSERFHWLTAPRSTIIQTSPVHVGRCNNPEATMERLMDEMVR